MKIKLKTKKARIELLPLLDMIFLVLVSFVYTFTSMTVQKGIPVRLPFAKTSVQNKKDHAVVTVKSDNTVYLDKRQITFNELTSELILYKNAAPKISVFLNADKGVVYEYIIKTIDAIRRAGIEKVSLETSDKTED